MVPIIVSKLSTMEPESIAETYVKPGYFDLWEGADTCIDKDLPNIGIHFGLKWVNYTKQYVKMLKLIIVPLTNEGKKLYFAGLVHMAERHGLETRVAFKWANSKINRKFVLLPFVAQVFSSTKLLAAYSNYGKNREKWIKYWKIEPFPLSIEDERYLVQIVHWILQPGNDQDV